MLDSNKRDCSQDARLCASKRNRLRLSDSNNSVTCFHVVRWTLNVSAARTFWPLLALPVIRLSRFFVPFRSLCSWCRTSVLCFHIMATNRLLRLRFDAIFICCLRLATSFGATTELGRIVLPANSATQTASAGLQKLSGRNGLLYIPTDHAEPLPLLILLHKAGGSASEWFGGSGSCGLCG